jgi:hypothetical protein
MTMLFLGGDVTSTVRLGDISGVVGGPNIGADAGLVLAGIAVRFGLLHDGRRIGEGQRRHAESQRDGGDAGEKKFASHC